jgi:hypothetical protein
MLKRNVLFLAILLLASTVQAAPLKIYVGASVGEGFDTDAGLGDFGLDTDDQTFKLFAGVSLGRVLGVEAAWHDFGDVSCCTPPIADGGFDIGGEGVSVAAVAGLPIWRLRLFAKAGVIAWKVDGELETIAGRVAFEDSGEDPMAGVGVDLKLIKKLSVRAELEVFRIADDNVSVTSVGLQYRFF